MERYIEKGGKRLRYGYTTGTCAAAAAKASALLLFGGQRSEAVDIDTPKGWRVGVQIFELQMEGCDAAVCCAVKDSGDDPDMTSGMRIYARVERAKAPGIRLEGGRGIGRVTRPGLSVAPGEAAINPVPRRMIESEVAAVLPEGEGATVTIFAPEGEEVARRTFNPKLGIEGGISIIGTSGIVEPMSEEAIKESLRLELSVLRSSGAHTAVFSPGNYGRDFCIQNGIGEKLLIKTSNYAGYMLCEAEKLGFREILWVGHIGKLVKLAAGIFNMHSSCGDARLETLAAYAALVGAGRDTVGLILSSNTAEEATEHICDAGLEEAFAEVASRASARCREHCGGNIKVGTVLFSQGRGLLAMCDSARWIMEEQGWRG
ncbi:cobalt-precorrin 5B C1-methyltransferase CbiD (plasmid) [Peptoclostridium acidaminophilum DSM 3953]|uniref:Cobalt-precorrin-5B C(1)-methyltransferase n=1 Tax=Peptoclostridium acidaminophilum DSM 3953 TaxID=1286171 RepID=W8U9T2_PEPAC|nr:cobalt-precorrin-5B (C(1))-methyltransferase CbiD [Peptoclostridium acidaminophilum]AHM57606.1 cobalt-precorrin 5B C1-methyltransferase CbiD [Peptoclostridium acidaminophilum DSM 3953]